MHIAARRPCSLSSRVDLRGRCVATAGIFCSVFLAASAIVFWSPAARAQTPPSLGKALGDAFTGTGDSATQVASSTDLKSQRTAAVVDQTLGDGDRKTALELYDRAIAAAAEIGDVRRKIDLLLAQEAAVPRLLLQRQEMLQRLRESKDVLDTDAVDLDLFEDSIYLGLTGGLTGGVTRPVLAGPLVSSPESTAGDGAATAASPAPGDPQADLPAAESSSVTQVESDQAPTIRWRSPPTQDDMANMSVDELYAALRDVEAAIDEATALLNRSSAELETRTRTLETIVEASAGIRDQLAEDNDLLASEAVSDAEAVDAARRELTLVRRELHRAQLQLLQTQASVFESTRRLLTISQDVLQLQLQRLAEHLAIYQTRLAEAEQAVAAQTVDSLRSDLAALPQPLRQQANENLRLAQYTAAGLVRLEALRQESTALQMDLARLELDFMTLRLQVDLADYSEATGSLLLAARNDLPDAGGVRRAMDSYRDLRSTIQADLIAWESQRRELIDLDTAVVRVAQEIGLTGDSFERGRTQLRRLLAARYELLGAAVEAVRNQIARSTTYSILAADWLDAVEAQEEYIAEHILWVPSAGWYRWSELRHAPGYAWERLLSRERWQSLAQAAKVGLLDSWRWLLPLAALAVGLLILRSRLIAGLEDRGRRARRPSNVSMRPTLGALWRSAALSVPGPLLIAVVGWSLLASGTTESYVLAAGDTCLTVAKVWFAIELIRQVFRSGGVAEEHFLWPHDLVRSERRVLSYLTWIGLPTLAVVLWIERLGNEPVINSLGRLIFVVGMIALAVLAYRFTTRRSAVGRLMLHGDAGANDFPRRCWFLLWSNALFASPILLAVASLGGFHFAALQLTQRVVVTVIVVAAAVIARAILLRWLTVGYKRLAMKQARERLDHQRANEGEPRDQEDNAVSIIHSSTAVQLSDVNQQTANIIRLVTALVIGASVYFVWKDFLPALSVIFDRPLWADAVRTELQNGLPVYVTLGSLLLATAAAILIVIAYRNLPGLVDIAVLRRLPMDAGARYAATALLRYVLAIAGGIYVFRLLGVGWGSIQWLVAAVSVGLGFGLQEIFANFVSGIILLFERPIRVGDTVTINNITGTVTRIRIRATTILDWDNKELIVPNRDFVTGNLVNWTLANANLRLVLRVGVAYGSDTQLATRLLYEVANESSVVLREPEPVVVFTTFGESSLDFELRIFVVGLVAFRRGPHELNMAIDQKFRQHGIEIAFPQRDLHIRSMSEDLVAAMQTDAWRSES